jgi:hypothetical protein
MLLMRFGLLGIGEGIFIVGMEGLGPQCQCEVYGGNGKLERAYVIDLAREGRLPQGY